jgi:hypothetical protein
MVDERSCKYIILDTSMTLENAFNYLYVQLHPEYVAEFAATKAKSYPGKSQPRINLVYMKKSHSLEFNGAHTPGGV